MSNTWIAVANSAMARIFLIEKNGNVLEIETLVHPQSRLHGRDLTSERPGRMQDSIGSSRHAMEQATSPKEVEYEIFAKNVATYLHTAHQENKFNRLYLAASPHFLGLLRQEILPAVTLTIQSELDKDITHMSPSEIKSSFLAHR